jgi:hypothetical protein
MRVASEVFSPPKKSLIPGKKVETALLLVRISKLRISVVLKLAAAIELRWNIGAAHTGWKLRQGDLLQSASWKTLEGWTLRLTISCFIEEDFSNI